MQETGLEALKLFLVEQLESNYALHEEHFKSYLTTILQNNLPTEQAGSAGTLAAECTPNNAEANEKLDEVLGTIGLEMNTVLGDARAYKAKELVQGYVRGERDAVTLVNGPPPAAGRNRDCTRPNPRRNKTKKAGRPPCAPATAAPRRNAALREIERRRAVLGETLRRSVREFADGELVPELPPAEGKSAA